MDSCSLMSRDSCNYSSSLSLGPRSCADSGYYSNRDTIMSQEYELMTGSNPIAIPGINPHFRPPMSLGVPGTFVPPQHYTRRPSGASLQFDPNHGQRCRGDSFWSDATGPQLRPALPAKLGVVGNYGNIKPASIGFPGNEGKAENPYVNASEIPGSNYEDLQRPSSITRQVSEGPLMSSSPESVYENQKDVKSAESLGFINMNYPIIYDRPTIDNRYNCEMNGRCYSFPEFDMKRKFINRKIRRNSLSSEKEIAVNSLNGSKSAPILDREVETTPNSNNWETRTADEAMSEDIYENIEIYNVPQVILSDIPPPLPAKRRYSERQNTVHSISESHDLDTCKELALSEEVCEEHYSRPISQDMPPNFDSHLYAEISDQLIKDLNDQSGLSDVDRSLGESNEESKGSFKEICNDYADLDAICAKLQENTTVDTQLPANSNEVEQCPVESNDKTSKNEDVLWKRFSTDQQRIERHTRRSKRSTGTNNPPNNRSERRRLSEASTRSSTNSLKHPCGESEGVQSLHTCTTLVTTV